MALAPPRLNSARAAIADAEAEQAFWASHHAELMAKYPEEFVAVSKGAVVAHSPKLQQLIQLIEGLHVDPTHVWVRFVTADQRNMLV